MNLYKFQCFEDFQQSSLVMLLHITFHNFLNSMKGLMGLISASVSNFFKFSLTFNFTQFNEIYAAEI